MAISEATRPPARRRQALFTVLAVLIVELVIVGAAGVATIDDRHSSAAVAGPVSDATGSAAVVYCSLTSSGQGLVRLRITNTHSRALYYDVTTALTVGRLRVGSATAEAPVPAGASTTVTATGPVTTGALGPVSCAVTSARSDTSSQFPGAGGG